MTVEANRNPFPWRLELTLVGPRGENYTICYGLDDMFHERAELKRPSDFEMGMGFVPLDSLLEVMRRREYRKEEFQDACRLIGKLLAERLEDKEGWHGVSRAEKLEDWNGRSSW